MLVITLLLHALSLSLIFGGQGAGVPGLDFPWRERRIEATDLRIVRIRTEGVVAGPASVAVAAPSGTESIEPVARAPAPTPSAPAQPLREPKAAVIVPEARPEAEAGPAALRGDLPRDPAPPVVSGPAATAVKPSDAAMAGAPAAEAAPTSIPEPERSTSSPQATALASRADDIAPRRTDPQPPRPPVDTAEATPREAESRRQAAAVPDAAREEAARQERLRQEAEREQALRQDAMRREAERVDARRAEAERQELARLEAARRETERAEAERRETERQEAARQEAARREAERAEAERRENERREAARLEAARREAERVEAGRREAERQDAARQEAARADAARQEQARQDAARLEARQKEEARREERLRAIGRQLNEEAAQRDAAATATRPTSTLPLSLSTARRARLWGRADANAELVAYAEAWERKIQLNTPPETVRELAQRPHTQPVLTVAIRSNGAVESVSFVRSSGSPEVDEAVRRIVRSHENYPAFPPALAREFDVIEIRRTWRFDTAIRLY